jgi:hypothetical protein
MMKKFIAVPVLLALAAAGAFGQGWFSAGGGVFGDASFYNGVSYKGDKNGTTPYYTGEQTIAPGVFVFFDARYVQAEVNFTHGWVQTIDNFTKDTIGFRSNGAAMAVGFSILGKYPFSIGGFTVFPLLGADYNLMVIRYNNELLSLPGTNESTNLPSQAFDLNQFGALAGVGADFPLSGSLFLRAELLFHFRIASKYQRDLADLFKRRIDKVTDVGTTFGMGPKIKVGVGFKLGG